MRQHEKLADLSDEQILAADLTHYGSWPGGLAFDGTDLWHTARMVASGINVGRTPLERLGPGLPVLTAWRVW